MGSNISTVIALHQTRAWEIVLSKVQEEVKEKEKTTLVKATPKYY